MRRVVGFFQPLRRHVRVNLGRHQVRVAEEFLHAAQVRAGVEQVRGVAVTQPIPILPMNRRSRRSTIDTIRLAVKR